MCDEHMHRQVYIRAKAGGALYGLNNNYVFTQIQLNQQNSHVLAITLEKHLTCSHNAP